MALEPISSMMTMQAQPVVNVKPVQPSQTNEKLSDAKTSESTQAAENVDQGISIVENSKNKGEAQNQTGNEDQKNAQAEFEQIRKAVEKMKKNMPHSEAVFGIHDGTNRVTIKLIDKDTKEVIKELPPEKTLDMIAKVWEMAGILVDEKR